MSSDQQRLLRELESCLRRCHAKTDICWQLTQTGMTLIEVRVYELAVRRRIREERTARHHYAQEAAA